MRKISQAVYLSSHTNIPLNGEIRGSTLKPEEYLVHFRFRSFAYIYVVAVRLRHSDAVLRVFLGLNFFPRPESVCRSPAPSDRFLNLTPFLFRRLRKLGRGDVPKRVLQ